MDAYEKKMLFQEIKSICEYAGIAADPVLKAFANELRKAVVLARRDTEKRTGRTQSLPKRYSEWINKLCQINEAAADGFTALENIERRLYEQSVISNLIATDTIRISDEMYE